MHFFIYMYLYEPLGASLVADEKVYIFNHRLNMELDVQSLFGLHVHRCTHRGCDPATPPPPPPPPPPFGLIYEGAIGQPR
jgi:hypothetical protein